MIHVVTDGRLEHGHHVGRETPAQPVRAEGAERDAHDAAERPDQKECPRHHFFGAYFASAPSSDVVFTSS